MFDPQPYESEYVLKIPLNVTRTELVLDPRDVEGARDLKTELSWLSQHVRDDEECDRILRLALMTHSRTGEPMNMCLRQAIIWERG
jgi:hypothetical protein